MSFKCFPKSIGIEIVGLSLNKVALQKTLENSYFFKYFNSA
jgi:hypothetical protein